MAEKGPAPVGCLSKPDPLAESPRGGEQVKVVVIPDLRPEDCSLLVSSCVVMIAVAADFVLREKHIFLLKVKIKKTL